MRRPVWDGIEARRRYSDAWHFKVGKLSIQEGLAHRAPHDVPEADKKKRLCGLWHSREFWICKSQAIRYSYLQIKGPFALLVRAIVPDFPKYDFRQQLLGNCRDPLGESILEGPSVIHCEIPPRTESIRRQMPHLSRAYNRLVHYTVVIAEIAGSLNEEIESARDSFLLGFGPDLPGSTCL
jgi:hypothetical protein